MCALRCLKYSSLQRICQFKEKSYFIPIRNFKTVSPGGQKSTARWKKLVGATAVGAGIGVYYSYTTTQTKSVLLNKDQKDIKIIKNLPDVKISKHVSYPYDNSGLDIILFQYPTCPFCCKVRAFLDYHGLSYKIVEVNPVLRQQIQWTDYKKVPIVLIKINDGYIQLNDSSMIISALSTYLGDKNSGSIKEIAQNYPTLSYVDTDGSVKSEILNRYFLMNEHLRNDYRKEAYMDEREWRKWADNVLVHVLSPNVYRTTGEALDAFKWFSFVGNWEQHFSAIERQFVIYVGALAMWLIGKKLKNKYHLKDDVRESLYDECNIWLNELNKKNSVYHGGNYPDLSDLAVYGVLCSIEGCEAFKDLLNKTNLAQWYFGMRKEVSGQSGAFLYTERKD